MSQYYWEQLRTEESSSVLEHWPKACTEGMQSYLCLAFYLATFLQLLTYDRLNKSAFVFVLTPFASFHALISHALSQ